MMQDPSEVGHSGQNLQTRDPKKDPPPRPATAMTACCNLVNRRGITNSYFDARKILKIVNDVLILYIVKLC